MAPLTSAYSNHRSIYSFDYVTVDNMLSFYI